MESKTPRFAVLTDEVGGVVSKQFKVGLAVTAAILAAWAFCSHEATVPMRLKVQDESLTGPREIGRLTVEVMGGESRGSFDWSGEVTAGHDVEIRLPKYYQGYPGYLFLDSVNYSLAGKPRITAGEGQLLVPVKLGPPSCEVTGVALGPSRQPLAGVRLHVIATGEEGVTDAMGVYRIVVPRACGGTADVLATRDGREEKANILFGRIWNSGYGAASRYIS